MASDRVEIRLDREQRRMLDELAEAERASVSETMRKLIKRAYEGRLIAKRLAAVARIAAARVEEVPDPEELGRQLDKTYDQSFELHDLP